MHKLTPKEKKIFMALIDTATCCCINCFDDIPDDTWQQALIKANSPIQLNSQRFANLKAKLKQQVIIDTEDYKLQVTASEMILSLGELLLQDATFSKDIIMEKNRIFGNTLEILEHYINDKCHALNIEGTVTLVENDKECDAENEIAFTLTFTPAL